MSIDKLKKSPVIYIFLSIILVFIISLVLFLCANYGKKRIFIFPSADSGEFVVEYRYLNKKPVQGEINLFVDELLLGSGVERTKKLFAPDTKVNSCFLRNGQLYIDLSDSLLQKGTNVVEIKDGVDLLKLNIKKNFPQVKEVVVFIGGKLAFENI